MEKWNMYDIFEQGESIIAGSTQKDDRFFYDFSLSLYAGDDKEKIKSNREIFREAFPEEYGLVSFYQIHSDKVIDISEYKSFSGWLESDIEADGIVTTQKGVVLATLGADCLSLLMYDKEAGVIGAAHSGWRGTAQNIAKNLFETMQKHGAKAERTLCSITPGIRECCYEVGSEVVEHFKKYPSSFTKKSNGKYMFDNAEVNYLRLLEMGFKKENIEVSDICTGCSTERFFSYRKESGCRGRFMNYIAMKP
ncbi:MAG TPA: peptidoglycan editing factor PgeF [Nitratifractor sp.]|nr:peptidoglycan editing factor PgeF [Nitratifractor sp.]